MLTPLFIYAAFNLVYLCIFRAKSTYNDIIDGNVWVACILIASLFIVIIWFLFLAFSMREEKLISEVSDKERRLRSKIEEYEKGLKKNAIRMRTANKLPDKTK